MRFFEVLYACLFAQILSRTGIMIRGQW